MTRFLLALFFIGFIAHPAPSYAQQQVGIAAVVNDDAISMTDVQDRMKLVIVSSGLPDNKDIRAKIAPQVIEGLIEEQLKLQEAKRNKITITDEEVQGGFKTIAEQNNFSLEKFIAVMKQQGVSEKTLSNQIKAQLAWNKVVGTVLRRRVDVSDSDVAARTERLKGKIGQTEYLVSEIYLPLDDAKRQGEVRQFAQRMATELQAKKAPFGAVAAQFSKAAGAEKGGTLGWIQAGQLPDELNNTLLSLSEGQISNPVQSGDGLHILYLQKQRTLTEEAIPPKDEIRNMIGFERLDRAQQRALLNLKSAAFIERRV